MSKEEYIMEPSGSLTTPTFSCYMRANPFSKEKAEYLKAHNRRMKEFGPRPYMTGDYPELPRHYPGVRVVYDWDQIDAVTDRLYYIPQRWTYHRDHLTSPTAKARRELPPQDIDYAKSATLRGVVSYTESQRRASSPSPCRSAGARRPPHPGSAVSRTMSQGSTLTTQTRGRPQRPRTCLPRARTPQPGEEQPSVQLTPLLPRKPPTGLPSRSQTPSSICSDQTSENLDHRPGRPTTGNSSITRLSRSNSRPATAMTTETRRNRSLSRPSTGVSRRTRWSDIADDTVSLNSSILELLQTITATDGKLTPLSPRANRMRHQKGRAESSESLFSGYLETNTSLRPNSGFNCKQILRTNIQSQNLGVNSVNPKVREKFGLSEDGNNSNVAVGNRPKVKSNQSQSKIVEKSSNYQGASSNAVIENISKNKNDQSKNNPEYPSFTPAAENLRGNMDLYPNTKSPCIDFGENQKNTKLTGKDNYINKDICNGQHYLDTGPSCNIYSKVSASHEQIKTQRPNAQDKSYTLTHASADYQSNSLVTKTSKTHQADVNTSGGLSEEIDVELQNETVLAHKPRIYESKSQNSRRFSENNIVSELSEKNEIPLSLNPSVDTGRTSSGSSSSQAEYLLVSGSSNTDFTETEDQYHCHADVDVKDDVALQISGDVQNERGEDSD